MASDTSLVFNVLARDRASAVFRKIRASADDTGKVIRTALGPALTPVLGVATAGAVGLGAALAGAGAAAGVFGAVFKTSFTEIQEASDKTQALQDKIALLDQQIKVANATGIGDAGKLEKTKEKAINELLSRYAQLPPATRKVVIAYDSMKASWKGFVEANKPATFGVMTGGFSLLSSIIPKLQPLFDVAAGAAGRLVASLTRMAGGGGVERLVTFLTQNAGPAFDNLGRIGKNLGITLGRVFGAFASNGQGILAWLAAASDRMAAWASAGEGSGLQKFVAYVAANGPKVVGLLGSLTTAAVNIAKAVTPLAPVSMAIAGALAAIIAAVPPGVITALVAAWVAYGVALKAYHGVIVLAGAATKIWTGTQWLLNAAMVAANFARATAQIAVYLVKQAAISVATRASAAAQWLFNAALTGARFAAMAVQLAAYATTQTLVSIGTKIWAGAQWLLNVAMSANPVGLVVLAIVALIAIIVLIATKTTWFQTIWKYVWGFIVAYYSTMWRIMKVVALGFWNWIKSVPGWIAAKWNAMWSAVKNAAGTAWNWIRTKVTGFYNWIVGLPGRISGKLRGTFNGLWTGFKSAVNRIIGGWNNLSFGIPGFSFAGINIPGVSVGTPNIPYLAKGGVIRQSGVAVVGERGPEMVSLSKGAQVTPLKRSAAGGTSRLVVDVTGADAEMVRLFRKLFRTANLVQS